MKRVGTTLFSAEHAAEMLETDVKTIRRMVVEERSLKAILMSLKGEKKPFHFGGIQLYTVNDDCSVTDHNDTDAGNLQFDVLELLPFRESLVNERDDVERMSAAQPTTTQVDTENRNQTALVDIPAVKPISRTKVQDLEILAALTAKGYSPKSLPKMEQGKSGVKASVRLALGKTGMWNGTKVFDKAWERLLKNGDIARTM